MFNLTFRMASELLSHTRELGWLFYFENPSGDLYAWSGGYNITHNGNTYLGLSQVMDFRSLGDVSTIQYRTREYTLSGIDAQAIGLIDDNVRGQKFKHHLCAIADGRVVADPILISEGEQDQIKTEFNADGTINITALCFEAMPFVNKKPSNLISHEGQISIYPTDAGMSRLRRTADQQSKISWQQG